MFVFDQDVNISVAKSARSKNYEKFIKNVYSCV